MPAEKRLSAMGLAPRLIENARKSFDLTTTSDPESGTKEGVVRGTIEINQDTFRSIKDEAANGALGAAGKAAVRTLFHESTHAFLFENRKAEWVEREIDSVQGRFAFGMSRTDAFRRMSEASSCYVSGRAHAWVDAREALARQAVDSHVTAGQF